MGFWGVNRVLRQSNAQGAGKRRGKFYKSRLKFVKTGLKRGEIKQKRWFFGTGEKKTCAKDSMLDARCWMLDARYS